MYRKHRLGTNFHRQAITTKIKPMKICADEELATVITMDYYHPRKLSPRKFNPPSIVTMKICTFTVHQKLCVLILHTRLSFFSPTLWCVCVFVCIFVFSMLLSPPFPFRYYIPYGR